MITQYSLDFNEVPQSDYKDLTPAERFMVFHNANPQVFNHLQDMAKELIARGRKRIGINMLLEVLRWNYYK